MPPPTSTNTWLYARRFGVVIDAGSSGSRLQIYSWKDAMVAREEGGESVYASLPRVGKGTENADEWVSKVEPGISSFADHPEDVASYLAPLLEHAQTYIPPSFQYNTPLFFLATAGMRLLSDEQQVNIIKATCDFLRFHSNFRIESPSSFGPCGSSVRIITGEEEGLFGWLAVNYLMDGFTTQHSERQTTYGFLDMGGASTQIAFEPSFKAEEHKSHDNLLDLRLRLLGGEEIQHQVFVATWLGYGTNQARERYVAQAIDTAEGEGQELSPAQDEIPDPCLPKELKITENSVHTSSSTSHTRLPHTIVGTGSFEQCLRTTSPLLNKTAPCPHEPCLFNGIHVPPIDFSVSQFIGVSEYWYSAEHVFGLGGPYDFVQYERAASEFCQRSWHDILKQHHDSRLRGRLGGDGELIEGGKVVGTGFWGEKVEISRLQMQCFKAAWIVNILHDGLGMPRIVDPDGNMTTSVGSAVSKEAEKKGLGRPTFQSVDTVGDIAFSWTLGKMVLEASKEIPPLSATTEPITDPHNGFSHWHDYPFSFKPLFWNFDTIEETISGHLPTSLTHESLGFSLVGFALYTVVALIMLTIYCRLRFVLRFMLRQISRTLLSSSGGGGRNYRPDGFNIEDGQIPSTLTSYPISSPLSTLVRKASWPLKRLTSFFRYARQSPTKTSSRSHSKPNSIRITPMQSLSFQLPPSPLKNSVTFSSTNLVSNAATTATATQLAPPSPRIGQFEEACIAPIYLTSRNSSQMNLSSLITRQPLSRTNSTLNIDLDDDE